MPKQLIGHITFPNPIDMSFLQSQLLHIEEEYSDLCYSFKTTTSTTGLRVQVWKETPDGQD